VGLVPYFGRPFPTPTSTPLIRTAINDDISAHPAARVRTRKDPAVITEPGILADLDRPGAPAQLIADQGRGPAHEREGNMPSSFTALLSDYRQRAGLTSAQLAAALHVQPAYLRRLERGAYGPPLRCEITRLAAALQLDAVDAERLIVAAGYVAPHQLTAMAQAEPALACVARLLDDASIPADARDSFRLALLKVAHMFEEVHRPLAPAS
jgi:transcriptional regulator with XRE-family HTH domain